LIVIGLVLIGVSLIGNAVLYAMGVSPFNTKDIRETQSVSADGIAGIVIHTIDGDIRVVPGGGDAITATVTGTAGRMDTDNIRLAVNERNGELFIEVSREVRRKLISFHPGEYELRVELPARQFERVEVVTAAADMEIRDVRAEQFILRAVHGEIETAGLSGRITARTETGDIELGVRAIEGDIHAETALGDIGVVTAEAPEKLALDLRTQIGERKVHLPGTAIVDAGPDVPEVRLNADVGDLEVAVRK
jgi:DUF4097 and DUF4098 domain-containing protein YvlB